MPAATMPTARTELTVGWSGRRVLPIMQPQRRRPRPGKPRPVTQCLGLTRGAAPARPSCRCPTVDAPPPACWRWPSSHGWPLGPKVCSPSVGNPISLRRQQPAENSLNHGRCAATKAGVPDEPKPLCRAQAVYSRSLTFWAPTTTCAERGRPGTTPELPARRKAWTLLASPP
jgi:hypothetical protein